MFLPCWSLWFRLFLTFYPMASAGTASAWSFVLLCSLCFSEFSVSNVEKGGKNMAALVATIATFFSGVMGMVSTLTTTIVGDDLLVLGVVAVPLVGISVGLLSRLFRQRV